MTSQTLCVIPVIYQVMQSSQPSSDGEWCSSQITKKNPMFCCPCLQTWSLIRAETWLLCSLAFSWCESDPRLCMSNGSATCSLHGAENFSERQTSLADASGGGAGTLTCTHLTDFPLKFTVSSHGGGNDVKWGKSSRRRERRGSRGGFDLSPNSLGFFIVCLKQAGWRKKGSDRRHFPSPQLELC